ncbi:cyclic nucleotide-binding protein [Pseudohongiella acticola]|uniref:Cyclic nucleotide-binding protein n=1 Tax=Pseudohongiella acticola TaxID=1524254 RepID=A0A1E8CHD0_9GAMM|nr:Crp/Fnr family transcriptional regulator [Pseudohongiella acticola]OFE11657.1 cyclic nucleotide-binding protein [Pseudohongiella acticola]
MENISKSCIVGRFKTLTKLDESEINLLNALEDDPREYSQDAILASIGSPANRFFTLKTGWACATRTLANGQRQILDIFLPGQIMGLREMSFEHNLSEFTALTDIIACPFPRQKLSDIFEQSPKLTDLFFMTMAQEQSMLIERVVNIGRRSAAERLAHLMVELKVRLNQTSDEFALPLNQTVIGDTLSMTSVHVSRTFKLLAEKELIYRTNGSVKIKDLDALIDFAGFDRSYLEGHCHWIKQIDQSAATL